MYLACWISTQIAASALFAQTPKYALETGHLFVPAKVEIVSNEIDLIIHLHGAHGVVEQNIIPGSLPINIESDSAETEFHPKYSANTDSALNSDVF